MVSVKRCLEKITRRLNSILSFGDVLESNNGLSKIQFDESDTLDRVRILLPYGFRSSPKKSSRSVVINSGNRNQSFILAANHESLEKNPIKDEAVEILDGNGATLELHKGEMRLSAKKILINEASDDLVQINLELLEILRKIVRPTYANNSGGPVIFDPTIVVDIEALAMKWKKNHA